MWSAFMEAGAEYPGTLGALLADILNESLFLTHPDYAYGATALLGALHEVGNTDQRDRLERLVLDLPKNARLHKGEAREPIPSWIEHAQNRLLGALKESNIVLGSVRTLWEGREQAKALAPNPRPVGPRVTSSSYSDEKAMELQGISLQQPANEEMFRLRKALEPLLGRDDTKLAPTEFENHWHVIEECERALRRHAGNHPKMAVELWGNLVGACENIARRAPWEKTSKRWKTVRRVLLKAAA
jgi:hypothetical protein